MSSMLLKDHGKIYITTIIKAHSIINVLTKWTSCAGLLHYVDRGMHRDGTPASGERTRHGTRALMGPMKSLDARSGINAKRTNKTKCNI